jgi:hypothetical protein
MIGKVCVCVCVRVCVCVCTRARMDNKTIKRMHSAKESSDTYIANRHATSRVHPFSSASSWRQEHTVIHAEAVGQASEMDVRMHAYTHA